MKETYMPIFHPAYLVVNSDNTTYGVESIDHTHTLMNIDMD